MNTDLDARKRAALIRMKWVNGLLILAMAVIFGGAHWVFPGQTWTPWVIAFAEAALVGGLADWFAVTALFRRPLGLPIPHTAIIPRNQARIGDGIGQFISNNFLDPDAIGAHLSQLDLGTVAGRWLADPGNRDRLAQRLAQSVPAVVAPIDDARVGRWIADALAHRLGPGGAGDIAAELLTLLTNEGLHRDLLDVTVTRMLGLVDENRALIEKRVGAQLPRWLPKAVDRAIYQKVLAVLHDALSEIAAPESPLRAQFDEGTERLIERLRQDEDLRERLAGGLERLLAHPRAVTVFEDLVKGLKAQVTGPDGEAAPKVVVALERLLDHLCQALANDSVTRAQVQTWAERIAGATLVRHRTVIADWISTVVKRWDTATTTTKIETQVGGDLQYIRLNGALVGGLIGLVLKATEYFAGS